MFKFADELDREADLMDLIECFYTSTRCFAKVGDSVGAKEAQLRVAVLIEAEAQVIACHRELALLERRWDKRHGIDVPGVVRPGEPIFSMSELEDHVCQTRANVAVEKARVRLLNAELKVLQLTAELKAEIKVLQLKKSSESVPVSAPEEDEEGTQSGPAPVSELDVPRVAERDY